MTVGDWIFAAVLGVFYVAVVGYVLMLVIGAWRTARGEEPHIDRPSRRWGQQ